MRKIKDYFLFTFYAIVFVACVQSNAQSQTFLETRISETDKSAFKKYLPSNKQSDSVTAVRSLNRMLADMYDDGYLAASVDSIRGTKDSLTAFLYPGQKYVWVKLTNGNLDEGMLSEAGFREKLYDNKPVKPSGISRLNKKILAHCENNGYPFASIRYDNFQFNDNLVHASLFLESGKYITIDSVIVRGNSKLSKTYLYSYLSVKPGDEYNESVIRRVSTRLKELPMVNEIRPFSVAFTDETARLILNIDDKKSSQIDGIIGVLPDYNQAGKVQVTGDLRIRLLSSFGRGELFDLNWKQPAPKTQDLKIKLNYPFILSSPFGIDLKLGIYKKDTSYLEVVLGGGVQVLLRGGNYFKVFVEDKKSTLLSTKIYENASTLPPFADVRKTIYGIGFKALKLDYRLNPRKGYSADFEAGAGNRVITKNGSLPAELYDSLELKTVQYSGIMSADYYIPLFSRNVINVGLITGAITGENTFDNELFRLGGLHDLRGFDEESIKASAYMIGKSEVRYILEQNSYLFAFFNMAWYERNTQNEYIKDTPIGFGAGITFETKLGIFSFNYALGKEFDNPVRFRAAKIHFGLINYF